MSMQTSAPRAPTAVQHWINLICAVLLFISPWLLGFTGNARAGWTAWIGGIVIFAMAIAAMTQFSEWEEWIALIAGVLVVIFPWVLGFSFIHAAVWACVVLGVIVVLSTISQLWVTHNSPMTVQ